MTRLGFINTVRSASTRGLLALVPQQGQPLLITPYPDPRILSFTLGLTFITGIVFGLLPALRASRPDPWTTLKDTMGSVAGTGGSLFLRKGLVTAQVALSFLLLFGAGLFVRSLQNLKTTDPGVALDNLVTFQLAPALSGYDNERATLFYRNLRDRLRATSGVQSAALATVPILAGDEWDSSMAVEGHQAKDGEDMQAFMNAVSPGYFQTMKTPLLEAIVNRRFADHFFPGRSAVGKHIGSGSGPAAKLSIEIVGVVADSLYEGPREGVHRQVFVPNWGKNSAAFYVRTLTPSAASYGMVRHEVRQLDSAIPVYGMKTVEGQLDETLLTDRLIAMLSAGFGLLATLLATVGLYGVMAFVVARRRKGAGDPFGARRAAWLGHLAGHARSAPAARNRIGRRHSRRDRPRSLRGRPVVRHPGARSRDRGLDGVLLTVVSAAAGLIPAQRASRIDPILALRHD